MIRTINLDGYITPTRLSAASKADEAPYILITKSIKPEGANAFLSLGATASEEVRERLGDTVGVLVNPITCDLALVKGAHRKVSGQGGRKRGVVSVTFMRDKLRDRHGNHVRYGYEGEWAQDADGKPVYALTFTKPID